MNVNVNVLLLLVAVVAVHDSGSRYVADVAFMFLADFCFWIILVKVVCAC